MKIKLRNKLSFLHLKYINLVIGVSFFLFLFFFVLKLKNKLSLVYKDFTNYGFLLHLFILLSIAIIFLNNSPKWKIIKTKENSEKYKDAVRKGLVALIIAYLARLDEVFAAFWLIFIFVISQDANWV